MDLHRIAAAEALIRHGANVNSINGGGEAPLHFAVESGIFRGSNSNSKEIPKKVTLSDVYSGDVSLVELLLAHGANINIAEKGYGVSPLHRACKKGNSYFQIENFSAFKSNK